MRKSRKIEVLRRMLDRIKKKFPKSKNKRIGVVYRSLPHNFFIRIYERGKYIIFADSNTIARLSRKQARGGLAHEVAHLEFDGDLRGLASTLDTERYESSEVYENLIERNTDTKVISIGFGSESYAFKKYCRGYERRKGRRGKTFGLTLSEIYKLAHLRKK